MTGFNWLKETIKARPDLFRLVNEFNQHPQNWIHPDILDSIPQGSLMRFLSGTLPGRDIACRWINSHLNLGEATTFWDFEDRRRRLALLSWERLNQLAGSIGCTLNADKIVTMIGRNDLADLKNHVGTEAYNFSLRRGSEIAIPTALRGFADAWNASVQSTDNRKVVGQRSMELGWAVLRGSLAEDPQPLRHRFHLKIPPDYKGSANTEDENQGCCSSSSWEVVERVMERILPKSELRCFN